MLVDRFNDEGLLITDTPFHFVCPNGANHTLFDVYVYKSGSPDHTDLLADGGTAAILPDGTFNVTSPHTSTFTGGGRAAPSPSPSPSPSSTYVTPPSTSDSQYGLLGLLGLLPLSIIGVFCGIWYFLRRPQPAAIAVTDLQDPWCQQHSWQPEYSGNSYSVPTTAYWAPSGLAAVAQTPSAYWPGPYSQGLPVAQPLPALSTQPALPTASPPQAPYIAQPPVYISAPAPQFW